MSFELILILCLLGGVSLALVAWAASLHNRLLDMERELKYEKDSRYQLLSDFIGHSSDMRQALKALGMVKTPRSEGEWVKQ